MIQLACHAPHVTLRIQRFHGRDQFGILIRLEALVVRDLRIYAESLDGDVYHYRDNLDNECDIVIYLRDGRYALLEVKLGGKKLIDEGVSTLNKVLRRIDTDKMGEPAFMAIVTGTDRYAYRRDDGIFIIPLGALKN